MEILVELDSRPRSASATRFFLVAFLAMPAAGLASVAGAADEIFVSDYATNKTSVYLRTANGDLAPLRTIQTGLEHPHGTRIETVRQEVFVPLNQANIVKVYDADGSFPDTDTPKRTIEGPLTLLSRPVGIAIDSAHQELYVTNDVAGDSAINVFPLLGDGNIAPLRTLKGPLTGIDGPNGIVVDLVHDELYIVNYRTPAGGSITVFPRTASGNVAPLRTIQGLNTGFNRPQELAVDLTHDELIVGNSSFSTPYPGSVLVFSRLDEGDVSPLRQISGPATELCTPVGLSLDIAHDEIVVANSNFLENPCPALVTVYSRTANGDVPPLRQIGPGPVSGFIEPISVTVRRSVDCTGEPDGTPCDDRDLCTQTDTCQAGVCTGTNPVTCTASDACHVAGVCDATTGLCSNPPVADGTSCDDGDACTQTDACEAGVCTGSSPVVCPPTPDLCHLPGVCDTGSGVCGPSTPVVCTALDACHVAGVCDTGTGVCSDPVKADGSECNDHDPCTTGETCEAGVCEGGTVTPCPDLVASYGFEEGAGSDATDSSGYENTGTIVGATRTTSGKHGAALWFNGTDSVVSVNDSPSLGLTTGMTLEAWVNPSWTTSEWQDVIYKGPDDTYYLEGSSPQNSSPAVGGTFSGTPLHGTDALPPNTWSHLAATYDGADLVLYVNGVQVASRPQTGAISTSAGPLTLGGDPLYGQYWAGLIDEVRIHNRALDPDEIQEDMAAPEVCGIKGGSLQFAADKQEISWASSVVSGPFDIVKGDLGLLRTSGGDFAGASCLQNDVWTKSSTDPEAPAPDGAFYYVMRCDGGTWADQTEVADREVTLSGCP